MILDKLNNLSLYVGANENIQKCIDFLRQNDLASLPVGKYELNGKALFCSVSEYDTNDGSKGFEAHDKYADVQCLLSGFERIDYANRAECTQTTEYNEVKDVLFFSAERFTPLKLQSGEFAIFFPEDAHRPNVTDETVSHNKKIIFKIKL